MKEIALYIHIPFCKQKCFYCDFPSFAGRESLMDEYIKCLCIEIKERCHDKRITTLFIGGGTPSYLNNEQLEMLMKTLQNLDYQADAEKSIECNPGTIDIEKYKIIKSAGMNRLSFGLQSSDDKLLKEIGRIHTFKEFKDNYLLARELGFNNINIDIMFGLPDQTAEDWQKTLKDVIELNPEHISAYSLIVEENTAFFVLEEKGKLNLPSEEEERRMYHLCRDILEGRGYHQYEISNYSKPNKQCRHNITYWKCNEYVGCGAAASSFVNNRRIKNTENIKKYIECIKNKESIIEEEFDNEEKDNIEEFMFMGLRMTEGIDEREFIKRFGKNVDSIYKNVINKNIKRGLLIRNGGKIYLSHEGIELSNVVMSDMIL